MNRDEGSLQPGRLAGSRGQVAAALDPRPPGWTFVNYSQAEEVMEQAQVDGNGEGVLPALLVESVQMNVRMNGLLHHTDDYELTSKRSYLGPQLVVRRGDIFNIKLVFNREYSTDSDNIHVLFSVGPDPMEAKGTQVRTKISEGLMQRRWSTQIIKTDGNIAMLSIRTPENCIVGKWNFTIQTILNMNSQEKKAYSYTHPDPIYLLFNPWSKDDQVYISDDIERDEYVMNEHGKLYNGNEDQVGWKPWNFGQFEDFILDCALFLLDEVKLSHIVRGDALPIVRALTALVNSCEDQAVLTGNWSGNYKEGTAPSAWVGSVDILQKYMDTKKPVLSGQCWVFSAVCTTLCRVLGIPCRNVSNFSSAHDCDGSITLDKHWDQSGKTLSNLNKDTVWTFHVWNEAYIARPDLPAGLGGWQAFDATPQETSYGERCAGPCPVAGIKEGMVTLPYDSKLIFAEVNADIVHWCRTADLEWIKTIISANTGRKISTKRPRKAPKPEKPTLGYFAKPLVDDPDRMDITDSYKHKEGSEEERTAVYRANMASIKYGVYDSAEKDVNFELNQKDEILIGNGFDVVLKVQNKSREERHVHVIITVSTCHYTGVIKHDQVKQGKFDVKLGAIKAEEAIMRMSAEEYLDRITDQASFQINVFAHVYETDQIHTHEKAFRLRSPGLEIKAPSQVKVGKKFECIVKFANSMPIHLTQCEWQLEGAAIQRTLRKQQGDLDPYEQKQIKVTLKAKRAGERQITASFNAKELSDVTGMHDIKVLPSEEPDSGDEE